MLFIELRLTFYRCALDKYSCKSFIKMLYEIIGIFRDAIYFDKENPTVAIVADPLDFVPNQKKKTD